MQCALPSPAAPRDEYENDSWQVYPNQKENDIECVAVDQRWWWRWWLTRLSYLDEHRRLILARLKQSEYYESGRKQNKKNANPEESASCCLLHATGFTI